MNEKKRDDIALFRYSLIVPFLSSEELEWGVKGELLQRMVRQIHEIPHSQKNSLNESTIRRYLATYREKGFEGLKPKSRSDIGMSQKISTEVLEKAFVLKREEPRRSARRVIQIMEAHQMVAPGVIRASTLYRHFQQNNLTAKELKKSAKTFRSFQADYPNQIWQSDVMYGPYLPDPERPAAKKQTYLVAIIDDFSRLVPHAAFYWNERLPTLENTFQKAILKRGIPEVFYVDNGKIFSANQMNLVCAELGIRKIHCEPYSPESKGKIERFFRTVQGSFLTELAHEKVDRLETLNAKFWAWLEVEYHQKIHSSTKDTPNNRWRQHVTGHLKKIEERQLQQIFLWRVTRKVNKVGLVSVQGVEFEVESFLAGKPVEVRFNHFDLSAVLVYYDGRFLQKARPARISRWNTAAKKPKPVPPQPAPKSNVNHLEFLQQQHHQQKVAHAQELLGRKVPQQNFSEAHFIRTVAIGLNRQIETLHPAELEQLKTAWQQFGPLEPALIHTALAKAKIEKGAGQHIAFYIQAITASHLKSNTDKKEGLR